MERRKKIVEPALDKHFPPASDLLFLEGIPSGKVTEAQAFGMCVEEDALAQANILAVGLDSLSA